MDKETRIFLKKLGKRIRYLRKAQGISQGQLAFEAHVSREAIGFIERGEQNPSAGMLLSIARVLGQKVKDVVDFDP